MNTKGTVVAKIAYFQGRGFLNVLLLLSCVSPMAWAEDHAPTPRQVVRQWVQSYPDDLAHAVTLTSPDFRNNLSPSEWVAQKSSILKNIRLKYVDSQILKEEIHGNRAVFKVKVLIDTIVGEQIQVEQYELGRYCSVWLLDKVQVLDERFLGHSM